MTKSYDTALEVAESIALANFIHVMAGLFIWEFVLNLDFEYSIVMGKRKFISTYPLYIGCRLCTLCTVILQLVYIDGSFEIDCQAWLSLSFIFGSLSVSLASALVILRVYALWERNKVVLAIASASWLANAGLFTYIAATARGHRRDDGRCIFDHILHTRVTIFSTSITDLILLVLMFAGILRWKGAHERGGLWWLMYTQGLTWIVVFALAEVPAAVFIGLNLSYHMNMMWMVPGVIAMTVGASRMYLGLVNSSQVGGMAREYGQP